MSGRAAGGRGAGRPSRVGGASPRTRCNNTHARALGWLPVGPPPSDALSVDLQAQGEEAVTPLKKPRKRAREGGLTAAGGLGPPAGLQRLGNGAAVRGGRCPRRGRCGTAARSCRRSSITCAAPSWPPRRRGCGRCPPASSGSRIVRDGTEPPRTDPPLSRSSAVSRVTVRGQQRRALRMRETGLERTMLLTKHTRL